MQQCELELLPAYDLANTCSQILSKEPPLYIPVMSGSGLPSCNSLCLGQQSHIVPAPPHEEKRGYVPSLCPPGLSDRNPRRREILGQMLLHERALYSFRLLYLVNQYSTNIPCWLWCQGVYIFLTSMNVACWSVLAFSPLA